MTARRVISIGLAAVITVGALYGLVHALSGSWHDVRQALKRANWGLLAGGLGVAIAAVVGLAERWHATLTSLGATVDRRQTYRWFMTGQLGKYAPGGVWHIVGQGELAHRGGVTRATAYSSVVITTVTLVAGAALAVSVGALLPGVDGVSWWAVLAGVGALVVLLEPHLRRQLLIKARLDPATLSGTQLLRLVVGCIPVWGLVGCSTWLTARSFGSGFGVLNTMVGAIGSWLVGIVTLPAPGGIGVREAVFAHLLSPTVGGATAALIALVARISFLLADVLCFVAARPGARRRTD